MPPSSCPLMRRNNSLQIVVVLKAQLIQMSEYRSANEQADSTHGHATADTMDVDWPRELTPLICSPSPA